MRLQKYMAQCGVASRRASEAIIETGRVSVNGEIVLFPGTNVEDNDVVCVDGKQICPEYYDYILLNKPRGVVSTSSDRHAEKTVLDLVPNGSRLYSVGRLDQDTEGLIILTNDGDLTFKLTHPKHAFKKTYACLVKGHVRQFEAEKLAAGVVIETDDGEYRTMPADVVIKKKTPGATLLEITIAEGKKRQVRKMCAVIGHPVIQLRRIALGELRDSQLKIGEWRYLTPSEINYLKGVL